MTKKSPNLGIVSEKDDGPAIERRRLPRLALAGEQFRLKQNGKVFAVSDLSGDGMALRIIDSADRILFSVGASVEGLLNIKRQKHEVKARVRHVLSDTVGCEFEQLPETTQAVLRGFLDPKVLGQELKPIPSSNATLWYHGPSGTDFLLWRGTDGVYRRMSLVLMGNYIQWDEGTGVTTGICELTGETPETRGIVRFETMRLKPDAKADSAKLNIAKTVILSSNLPEDLKNWCVRHLEKKNG